MKKLPGYVEKWAMMTIFGAVWQKGGHFVLCGLHWVLSCAPVQKTAMQLSQGSGCMWCHSSCIHSDEVEMLHKDVSCDGTGVVGAVKYSSCVKFILRH